MFKCSFDDVDIVKVKVRFNPCSTWTRRSKVTGVGYSPNSYTLTQSTSHCDCGLLLVFWVYPHLSMSVFQNVIWKTTQHRSSCPTCRLFRTEKTYSPKKLLGVVNNLQQLFASRISSCYSWPEKRSRCECFHCTYFINKLIWTNQPYTSFL